MLIPQDCQSAHQKVSVHMQVIVLCFVPFDHTHELVAAEHHCQVLLYQQHSTALGECAWLSIPRLQCTLMLM